MHALALIAVAICDVAAPFTLLTLAERDVSSSLAGILVATTPLMVGVLAVVIDRSERPTPRGWVGLLLGFAGVVALLGLQLSGDLAAAGMLLLAAAGYAVATLLVRRLEAAYLLIAEVGATRASLSVYLAPVFSVLVGALALGEGLTASALAGLGLILIGSWLAR